MTSSSSETLVLDESAKGLREPLSRALVRMEEFFLAPASPRPLAVLRIGLALVLLAQALLLKASVLDLFASDGLIQGDLARAFVSVAGLPRLSLLVQALAPLHISEAACIQGVCLLYVASIVLFGFGLFTRAAAVVAWLLHWTLMNTGETNAYGVDLYAHVALFYLIFAPCGAMYSVDALRKGISSAFTSTPARLALRVFQLHLCISYLCSAVEKATGPQWWNGELLWRALNLPVYYHFDMTWLAQWPRLSQSAGIGSLFLEMFYFIGIWPARTRRLWMAGMISMHLGISLFLNLGLFGVFMSILNFTIWGISAE